MRTWVSRTVGGAALALLALSAAPDARACGGTFCDAAPVGRPPMPVDQSGENILFVLADGHVEAHIQIQYTGDPARFAWLVPVQAVPELSVGSQALFTNLLNGTVPTFALRNTADVCTSSGGQTSSGGCGFSSSKGDLAASGSFNGTGAGANDSVPQAPVVVGHEAVGAFDVTVLQPKTADEITAWLDTNGFLHTPDAPPILQGYIDSGHVFAAVKLQPGAGVSEIHPLVIKYPGSEPCIPLKLTAVAATEDMGVRAFFLGDRRMVPTTYREVTVNPALFDWVNYGTNYTSVVSRAVDEPGADGHAFVTEYAGPSSIVSPIGIYDPSWNADAFRTTTPDLVMSLLGQQGLVSCTTLGCVTQQPLILPIVRKYLPAPAGMSEEQFYSCVSCNESQIDQAAWNADLFASELDDRVIQPGKHASELLAGSPYVTRLFTTISPDEMTEDPEFAPATLSAPPVPSQLTATMNTTCSKDVTLDTSGTPTLALDASSQMPRFSSTMPFALTIDEYDVKGTRTPLYDNSKTISDQIQTWNASVGYPHAATGSPGRSSVGCGAGGNGCGLGVGPTNPGAVLLGTGVLSVIRRLRRRRRA